MIQHYSDSSELISILPEPMIILMFQLLLSLHFVPASGLPSMMH